jgi:hypothetical protein
MLNKRLLAVFLLITTVAFGLSSCRGAGLLDDAAKYGRGAAGNVDNAIKKADKLSQPRLVNRVKRARKEACEQNTNLAFCENQHPKY